MADGILKQPPAGLEEDQEKPLLQQYRAQITYLMLPDKPGTLRVYPIKALYILYDLCVARKWFGVFSA